MPSEPVLVPLRVVPSCIPLVAPQTDSSSSSVQGQTIVQVCSDLGLSYTHLPSRASHDAQEIASFTNMGMIFVPSQAGVSHAETEYTSPEQCTQGANVLLHTLLKLDRHYLCD